VSFRPATRRAAVLGYALLAAALGALRQSPVEAAASEGGGQDPQQLVADLAKELFATLDRGRAAIRRDPSVVVPRLDELLSPHFDKEYTARLVLGAHWRGATPEYRQRFALALFRTLLRTYAGAVSEWTPDRFKLLPLSGDAAALQVTVHTEVTRPGGAFVPVDYRLHKTADGWKLFDVLVDGVSYVRIHHDDVDTDVNQRGLDVAIARLEKLSTGVDAHAARVSPDAAGTRRSDQGDPQEKIRKQ
jgi:phospholipid transport system substrate-binding protein